MGDRFHTNSPLAPGVVVLRGPEAHHLGTVCRARPGDELRLFNGDGHEYPARVVEVGRRDVAVEVLAVETPARELPFTLRVAAPLPKGDRAQFLVEKLTELGVAELTLLSARRGVVAPREAKVERLARYVIEASKQCGRNVLMRVAGPVAWEAFIRDETAPMRLVAHPGGGPLPARGGGGVTVAVGPEGGLTEEEVALAAGAGWRTVGLGPTVLRVETAAVALAARLALG
jgi:16S rRNA (uracil1498-N3)-methyltransferase